MEIDYEYLARISKDAVLYTSRKTTNILDGEYNSVYHGKSLELLDFKEYSFGDDFSSIDWKTSSRTDTLLVRRNIAEKKHSILIIGDTGTKMDADTPTGDSKSDIALMSLGVITYLLSRQGSDVGLVCADKKGVLATPFKTGSICVEELLHTYGESLFEDHRSNMNDLLQDVLQMYPMRRMIVFVITDIAGLRTVKNATLSRMTERNDVYFICIDDAPFTGSKVYDRMCEEYIDRFLAGSRSLKKAEQKEINNILNRFKHDATRSRVVLERVKTKADVVDTVLNLFERGRNGIFG